jgi:hypothetical protein
VRFPLSNLCLNSPSSVDQAAVCKKNHDFTSPALSQVIPELIALGVGAFHAIPQGRFFSLPSNVWNPIAFFCRGDSIGLGQYTQASTVIVCSLPSILPTYRSPSHHEGHIPVRRCAPLVDKVRYIPFWEDIRKSNWYFCKQR